MPHTKVNVVKPFQSPIWGLCESLYGQTAQEMFVPFWESQLTICLSVFHSFQRFYCQKLRSHKGLLSGGMVGSIKGCSEVLGSCTVLLNFLSVSWQVKTRLETFWGSCCLAILVWHALSAECWGHMHFADSHFMLGVLHIFEIALAGPAREGVKDFNI